MTFAGDVKREELPALFATAEVFVLPRPPGVFSIAGLPNKLGEYLASGRPVVVNANGDIPRYLQDGVSAYLVDPADEAAFTARLRYVLEHRDEAAAVGARGREVAVREFDYRRHGARLVGVLLVAARRARGARRTAREGLPRRALGRRPAATLRPAARSARRRCWRGSSPPAGTTWRYVVTGLAGGERVVDGVRVCSAWDPERGVRYVRAVTHRYPRLYAVLRAERGRRLLRARRRLLHAVRGAGGARRRRRARCSPWPATATSTRPRGTVLFAVRSVARCRRWSARLAHAAYRDWALPAADWVAVQNREQAAACAALGLRTPCCPTSSSRRRCGARPTAPERDAVWAGNVVRRGGAPRVSRSSARWSACCPRSASPSPARSAGEPQRATPSSCCGACPT